MEDFSKNHDKSKSEEALYVNNNLLIKCFNHDIYRTSNVGHFSLSFHSSQSPIPPQNSFLDNRLLTIGSKKLGSS